MIRQLLFCAGAGGVMGLRPGWNSCLRSRPLLSLPFSKMGLEKIFIIRPD
jgi:hypothetical protein